MNAATITNTLLLLAKKYKVIIRPMKLQKLLWFSHGYYSGIYNEKLIDEPFEAWTYGPVIPSVYHNYSYLGSDKIHYDNFMKSINDGIFQSSNSNHLQTIENVLSEYGEYNDIALSQITHRKNSSWWNAYQSGAYSSEIEQENILNEFRSVLNGKI